MSVVATPEFPYPCMGGWSFTSSELLRFLRSRPIREQFSQGRLETLDDVWYGGFGWFITSQWMRMVSPELRRAGITTRMVTFEDGHLELLFILDMGSAKDTAFNFDDASEHVRDRAGLLTRVGLPMAGRPYQTLMEGRGGVETLPFF
ncbi:hypothetical protein AAF712_006359 [Marasmius tenuissimus]|uniref:Uncharacterized protein n=1 Tax=Marasmius tenuissimus TaxID=585030 RepID=A0ABR2ZZS4_9AGAR|nr:hypothetical protein PM082_003452 [Marasmius tenuissimus]